MVNIGGLACDTPVGVAPAEVPSTFMLGGGGLNPKGLNSGLVGVEACWGAPGLPLVTGSLT